MKYLALILILLAGCASNSNRPTDATVNVGSSFRGAWGHTESADYDVQQAKALMPLPAGKNFLDAAIHEHSAVFDQLKTGMDAQDKMLSECTEKDRKLQKILESVTYRVGVWAVRAFWVVVGFLAVHFILGAIAPGLASTIGNGVGSVFRGIGAAASVTQKLRKK